MKLTFGLVQIKGWNNKQLIVGLLASELMNGTLQYRYIGSTSINTRNEGKFFENSAMIFIISSLFSCT